MNYKLITLENQYGTKTLKQHAYIADFRGTYWEDKYNGNRQVCRYSGGAHDGDKFIDYEELQTEDMDNNICKKCKKIINKLT